MTLALHPDAQDLLFRTARTATRFTDQPVGEDEVRAVYDLVKLGPTAMNANPLRVLLVRSPQARERLAVHMAEGNRRKVLDAPLVAVLAADVDFHDDLPRLFPHAPGARDRFAEDELAREDVAVRNAMLQAGYFIVGVRAAGLAAGPMTGMDAAGVEKELFPDGRHRVVLVVALGHPAPGAGHPRGPRPDYDEVVSTV
ncbi:malonic semialdehyde reductase [Vallicoccus soli]|uniref:Malonic semialdehyde reductase n=1 Tax=Vallicoccus soli TaxID=2339232 RepID=A0A3A3YS19_9ACTN|nr:malonic semialdehyde reductase [Vallicoccus soli]RJK94190.1 malonic semialdehyde reductase [Vallicoccus soli]